MRWLVVVMSFLLVVPALADVCRVGKPCGNSCISVHDTCHIGSSSGGGGADTAMIVIAVASGVGLLGLVTMVVVMRYSNQAVGPFISMEDGAQAGVVVRF